MVNNNVTLEYNSSDKINLIQKITGGGLYLSSNRIITSKLNIDDNIFNLTGIIIVSPKEINFNYNLPNVKLIMLFIHKNNKNQLLLLHLPIFTTQNSKPTIDLNNFFKSIINKSSLLNKKNKVFVDELLLNNINFGNKAPEIKVFHNNTKFIDFFKPEIIHKIKDYTSITSVVVSSNTNSITTDLFNKLKKYTNSLIYSKLFTDNNIQPSTFDKLLTTVGIHKNKFIERFVGFREGFTPAQKQELDQINTLPVSASKKAEIKNKMIVAYEKADEQKAAADAAKKAPPATPATPATSATPSKKSPTESKKFAANPIQNLNSNPTDTNGNGMDDIYIECKPSGASNNKIINLVHGGSGSKCCPGGSGSSGSGGGSGGGPGSGSGSGGGSGGGPGSGDTMAGVSHALSKMYHFLSQCNIEYAIIGFLVTIAVLYAIHHLYKKGFSKGEASNTLPRIDLIKSTAERV